MKFIRQQHFEVVCEDIIRSYLKICFWLSWLIPFGAIYLFDKLKPYIFN